MTKKEIHALLQDVAAGTLSPEAALKMLKTAPFRDMGFAKPDFHRGIRQGVGEVIYGEGKTANMIVKIIDALAENGKEGVLITRLDPQKAEQIKQKLPILYYETARIGYAGKPKPPDTKGRIAVVSAGTADLPVAEEAAVTAELLGNPVQRIYDVGVSGIHRLLAHLEDIADASVIVAVAGMEGALASVVGGLADCPVIAVPTSVGYGASYGGLAALLTMLNSCASGVCVVNIDNGFGGGYTASLINHKKGE